MLYDNEKPKRKRKNRSCQQTLIKIVLLGGVMWVVLTILGMIILSRIFTPELVYVEPDFAIDVQPIDVSYRPPEFPAYGGVFENGFYFQVYAHTVDVTIENGTAEVNHILTVANAGSDTIDGVFIIPLPSDHALESVSVEINGELANSTPYRVIEGRARLQSLAQEHNDPSLLAYTDKPFIEVNVFPLDGTRTVTVNYTHFTESINGLVALDIPLAFPIVTEHPIGQFSVTIAASDELPLRNIYPATLDLTITQSATTSFIGSANLSGYMPPQNLELYYARSNADITANVITYRESSDDDGYFVLIAEPATVSENQIIAKDVILVLDQSGSMGGVKWQQAQEAATYVLEHLNPYDRFFITTFSTSYALFDNTLSSAATAQDAIMWVNNRTANGGTNINDALLETLRYTDTERPTTLLFMTDGQATEGVTDTQAILDNLRGAVSQNVRIFVFGVGDNVNTTLLDSIAREYRGETGYVRQSETIDAEISNLYAKVSSPVLTNIRVDFGDAVAGDFVPAGQLPDLYVGQQLILVGRYRRGGDDIALTLTGTASGEPQTYTIDDLYFQTERGGRPFIARLWAARRVGEMLNIVRLGDEDPELVNSIVTLSLHYGIITPYTQFLLEQDDVLTAAGQQVANTQMVLNATILQQNQTGASAVDAADMLNNLSSSRNFVSTPSYGYSGSGSSYRQQIVTITSTPLPPLEQTGLLLTIDQLDDDEDSATSIKELQYIMSLNADAFERALFILPESVNVGSPSELPVLIGNLVNAHGIERGIQVYNETFGLYLPLISAEQALVDEGYEVAPPPPIAQPPLRTIHEKTFILQDDIYIDTTFEPDTMIPETITIDSDKYNALVATHPDLLPYLSVGAPLIIVWDSMVYEIHYK
jgi:Ca-activated chloride channel homolog